MWATIGASESQTWLNKDLIVAKFGGSWSPKSPTVSLGPWPNHHSVCSLRHLFSEGGTRCSILEKTLCALQCFIWCLTSCALLPWANEVQCKMWAQMVISPILFPSRETSKPLLTNPVICFLLGHVAACSYQAVLTFFCISNVATLEYKWCGLLFFLEPHAKKHSTFVPLITQWFHAMSLSGPLMCDSKSNSAPVHYSAFFFFF